MVAYHNSWPYLARRFRLDFAGSSRPSPACRRARRISPAIVEAMRARDIRIVVREPHEPERDVGFIAAKAGATVVVLATSVGALPGAE